MVGLNARHAVGLREARFDDCEWSLAAPATAEVEAFENPPRFDPSYDALILTDASAKEGISAAVILNQDFDTLANVRTEFRRDGLTTTLAEACAIFVGLSAARDVDQKRVIVWSDCQPLVAQLSGAAQTRSPDMVSALKAIRGLGPFDAVRFEWFKRTAFLHYFIYRNLDRDRHPTGRTVALPLDFAALLRS